MRATAAWLSACAGVIGILAAATFAVRSSAIIPDRIPATIDGNPTTPTTTVATPVDITATSATIAAASAQTTTSTTTTLPPLPAEVFNPECVRVVRAGDSVSIIADEIGDPALSVAALLAENGLDRRGVIHPGGLIDVCTGNGINDINGASRLRPDTVLIADADPELVRSQQQKLNELFEPYGIAPLAVDGISGPLTRQQLCIARLLLGLPISRSDMAAASDEENSLFALASVTVPPGAATQRERWVLIDMTCQVLIAGEGDHTVRFILPASTGEAGYETRTVNGVGAFRFNPAADNNGWHDSSEFPADYDNPLNGNMYKPIYFSNGQAIHGATNVPPRPASKGCVRLRVSHHDQLLDWLDLASIRDPIWSESHINLAVTSQGRFLPDPKSRTRRTNRRRSAVIANAEPGGTSTSPVESTALVGVSGVALCGCSPPRLCHAGRMAAPAAGVIRGDRRTSRP